MKKLCVAFIFSLFILNIWALTNVKGKVVDATTQEPLDFVNVALYKQNSETPASGVTSDVKGEFQIPTVPNGKYELRFSFIGYNPINIPLNITGKTIDIGIVKLMEDSKTLTEVEVVGQGTQMRFDIDKRVFSVDQNIAAAGGSATEVLQNIPSVDVDNEGNISLRNSSNVEVWINGKPSGLTADNRAQILQQMPAESIESIELMTNPSAKFNPEGTSGIINLVLKKNRKAGYYGSVSAGTMYSQGGKPGGTLGANINYSSSKVDAYLNVGYRAMNFIGGGYNDRYTISNGDTTSLLSQTNTTSRSFGGTFIRSGADFHLNSKNTLSLSGFGMFGSGRGGSDINFLQKDLLSNTILRDFSRENTGTGIRPSYSVSLDHRYDIDGNGSSLFTSLSYSAHQRNNSERYVQTDNLTDLITSDITQDRDGENSEFQFKLDYTKKFSDASRLEAGLQNTLSNRFSPSKAWDNLANEEIKTYFNEFNYNEQIHAAYMTYGNRFDKLSIQGGLRAEYMWKQTSNMQYNSSLVKETQTLDPQTYFQLFPSMYLSYSLPQNNELQLNYSRRVNRPRGNQINPFKDYSDSTSISYGNPDLLPQFSSALEFNYLKSWDNHSISTSAYYRFTDDVIQGVRFLNNDIMENTFMNVTKSQNTGLEFVAKNRLLKVVNLTSSLNLYYSKMDSATYTNPYNSTLSTTIPGQDNFSWSGRVMANIVMGKNTSGQITGEYSAPRLIAQGKETASYSIDLGLRQTFFDRNLSVNFMVRDLLNTRRRSSVTWGDGFYQKSESYFNGRMVGVTATYSFGNMKPKKTQRRTDESSSDMDMNGMD